MASAELGGNFIQAIIDEDNRTGLYQGRVHTRFPPEPNGYLHIGHAKSVVINYGLASRNGGLLNLRFDDTNPTKESQEFVDAIIDDVRWLGADWGDRLYFASDYFDQFYDFAVRLIEKGKAYVCHLSPDEMRAYRGTLTGPGTPSPWRDRPYRDNLAEFQRMKDGHYPEGACTLRAKIDMASPNINLRDPVLYRILFSHHHRTQDRWCIYPMYDYAHPLSDALENITHSICTLEYADHRPLYDWILDQVDWSEFPATGGRPKQIEFARLNVNYTVMSKRKLRRLVEQGLVEGWDDPRMPTIAGLRRRGYTPETIWSFCEQIGVAKRDSVVDLAFLEHCARQDLNQRAMRVMAVLKPVKVVITNYPQTGSEYVTVENNPEDAGAGCRDLPFGRELYIEREDFMEDPHPQFYRLAPGREVRLKGAYVIQCHQVLKAASGQVTEIHCTYDPASRGGEGSAGRRVKSTIHWVCARHAVPATVRLYDRLFLVEDPEAGVQDGDFTTQVDPASLQVLTGCLLEPGLDGAQPGSRYQFLRQGYFYLDPKTSRQGQPVFNRIVTLRDSWTQLQRTRQP